MEFTTKLIINLFPYAHVNMTRHINNRYLRFGDDLSRNKVRRLLKSDASKHMVPLWCQLFSEHLYSKGEQRNMM